jgi:hypothetical protein
MKQGIPHQICPAGRVRQQISRPSAIVPAQKQNAKLSAIRLCRLDFFTKIQTMTKYIVAMLFWGLIHIVCHKSDYSAVQLAKAPGGYLFWLYI